MPDDLFYLVVEEDVVEILEAGQQGLPGPGFTPEILATIAAANSPSPENPFATINDLPTTPEDVGAAPAVHPHADKADLVDGKVPAWQLPAFVDDVLEYATLGEFPVAGEAGKIYVALDTNLTYRWGGSGYAKISQSLALGETAATAYRGDHGKAAYEHATETQHAPADAEKNHPVAEAAQDTDFTGTTPFSWPPVRLAAKIAAKIATMFGAAAGTICQGNDARLADARTPTAHKNSHATGGDDALAPNDIGALSKFANTDYTSGVIPSPLSDTHNGTFFIQIIPSQSTIALPTNSSISKGWWIEILQMANQLTFNTQNADILLHKDGHNKTGGARSVVRITCEARMITKLTLASATNFSVGQYVSNQSGGGGVIIHKTGNNIYVYRFTGGFNNGDSIDNAYPFVAQETTISDAPVNDATIYSLVGQTA